MCTYGSNSLPPTPLGMVALKPRPTVGSNLRPFLSACCIRYSIVRCFLLFRRHGHHASLTKHQGAGQKGSSALQGEWMGLKQCIL